MTASTSTAPRIGRSWDRAGRLVAMFPAAVGLVLVPGVVVALWGALGRTSLSDSHLSDSHLADSRLTVSLLTALVLLVWLTLGALVSRTRTYERSAPLAAVVILVPVVAVVLLLGASTTATEVLAVLPREWPISFQAVRILGGVFLVAWLSGEIEKPWFCVWAGSVDLVIGLTALPVGWWVATGAPAATVIGTVWNLVGLLDFAVAIVIVLRDRTMTRDFFDTTGPVVRLLSPVFRTIFSFAVPIASVLHVISIRQLVAS